MLLRVEHFVVPASLTCDHRRHPVLRRTFAEWPDHVVDRRPAWPARLYVDRRGGANRRMMNEDELVSGLQRHGFVPVTHVLGAVEHTLR